MNLHIGFFKVGSNLVNIVYSFNRFFSGLHNIGRYDDTWGTSCIHKQRVSESMVPSIGELKIQMANQNAKEKSKGISSDIFETME